MPLAYASASRLRVPGGVLEDGDQTGRASTLRVGPAHQVARALRSDHDHVDPRGRHDLAEVDREAVGEQQHVAGLKPGCDVGAVELAHELVRGEHHHQIAGCGGLAGVW